MKTSRPTERQQCIISEHHRTIQPFATREDANGVGDRQCKLTCDVFRRKLSMLPTTLRAKASLFSYSVSLLLLLVCKVRCEPLCGSWFDDVSSRTVLAPIVFEGEPRVAHSWTERDQVRYNLTFRVDRVFKGTLPKRDSGSGFRNLMVGIFGHLADRANCVGTNVSLRSTYVVFLNSTVVGRSGRLNIYRITSFSEPSTKEVIENVQKYSRAKSGK